MANHGRALVAAVCPIAAGHVLASGWGSTISLCAGQDVMLVDDKFPAHDFLACLGQSGVRADAILVGIVQVGDTGCDHGAVRIRQGPLPIRSLALTADLPSMACWLR